ncbi:hypothetical protein B0H11DRAFT_2248613 [Mycena galericulata]|nr:hypothetical protein B0H11DRAFT_2248613 [Mycena galericulata]
MPPGRKRLDPATKAEHRRETLRRYAEKNKAALREAARLRMQRLRATAAQSPRLKASMRQKSLQSAAKYRERNREAIRVADAVRRAKKYIETSSLEAFNTKNDRRFLARTQRAHEGRPPPSRPRAKPYARTQRRHPPVALVALKPGIALKTHVAPKRCVGVKTFVGLKSTLRLADRIQIRTTGLLGTKILLFLSAPSSKSCCLSGRGRFAHAGTLAVLAARASVLSRLHGYGTLTPVPRIALDLRFQ